MEIEPQPPDRMFEMLTWLETSQKRLLYGFFAILAVSVAVYVTRYNRNESELSASNELFLLESKADSGEGQKASEFTVITREYGGTHAGRHALLFAAEKYYSEGKFGPAKTSFEEFSKGNNDAALKAVAEFGIAACDEADGNPMRRGQLMPDLPVATMSSEFGPRSPKRSSPSAKENGWAQNNFIRKSATASWLATGRAKQVREWINWWRLTRNFGHNRSRPFLPTNSVPAPSTNPPPKR